MGIGGTSEILFTGKGGTFRGFVPPLPSLARPLGLLITTNYLGSPMLRSYRTYDLDPFLWPLYSTLSGGKPSAKAIYTFEDHASIMDGAMLR